MSNNIIGIGGAPSRATTFPKDAKGRKSRPVASGVLDYFPDALVAVSEVSWRGNEQHNPGQPLHWDRSKSQDDSDCLIRHFLQRGTLDSDGLRHTAKLVWRALAILQKEIEAEAKDNQSDDAIEFLKAEFLKAANLPPGTLLGPVEHCRCDAAEGCASCAISNAPVTRDINPD